MNIIERNYLPKINMKNTQKAIIMIDELMKKGLHDKLELFEVRQPVISSRRVSANSSRTNGSRQINFDSSNDNVVYYLYDDYRYWLVNTIKKLDIKNNNALLMFSSYVNRDVEIKNIESMEKRKLNIEYRYDVEERDKVIEKSFELNKQIYNIIKDVQKKLNITFPELADFELPKVADEKELKKISSAKNLSNTLANVASEEGTFLLKDIRNPLKDRNIYNTFELSLYSFNKEINEAYWIYKIQDRRTMEDIESFISESESAMEEYIFGKDILKGNSIRTLNIEIDLDALYMLILQKSHIFEVQSGESISEIESILESAEVEHL